MKQFQSNLKRKRDEEESEERERVKKRRKLKEQNELKSSSYQIITNTTKLKRMSKKQIKNFRKLSRPVYWDFLPETSAVNRHSENITSHEARPTKRRRIMEAAIGAPDEASQNARIETTKKAEKSYLTN